MSTGQMVEDVRLALREQVPVHFYSRVGGNVPLVEEVNAKMFELVETAVH
jgi:2-oxoglutarate ferredoxin oxidoreductase subunit alpha